MSGSAARLAAIGAVKRYRAPAGIFTAADAPGDIFGKNVFTKAVMQSRLPKPAFKSLMATIEHAKPLDPAVADVVAATMKDWAMEKGATHYAHVRGSRRARASRTVACARPSTRAATPVGTRPARRTSSRTRTATRSASRRSSCR